jgi:hypothetical protein
LATPLEVVLHRNIGSRYLGLNALGGLLVIVLFAGLAGGPRGAGSGAAMAFLLVYLAMCARANLAAGIRERRVMDHALTPQEIAQSVDASKFPAILTPPQAAELLQVALTTLYRKVSEGCFKSAVRRGKPLRFWRDRLIIAFLCGRTHTAK